MKKHNVDTSLMQISLEDQNWANSLVFDTGAMSLKSKLNEHYLQYFPPVEKKLNEKVASLNFLNLRDRKNLDILDLSTGCGHFLVLLKSLGHQGQGTEIPNSITVLQPLYDYYGLNVFPLTVEKQKEIKLPKKYQVIKSARTVFNENWTTKDWEYFKENIFEYLVDDGELFLRTNIKAIPSNLNDPSTILGNPIKGWNTLTYLLKK